MGTLERSISREEIMAARTKNGGWTRATLASWGVPWPPPKGWKAELTAKLTTDDRADND